MLKNILFIMSIMPLLSCTAGMPEAFAPTNPPRIEKSLFNSKSMIGCYQHEIEKEINSPKMFLWPITKTDQKTGELVVMSLDEQSDARQRIVSLADLTDELSALRRSELEKIAKVYDLSLLNLEAQFIKNKCYSFCDPSDFLCDPNDKTILQIDVWKQTEDAQEIVIISECQENQTQRDIVRAERKEQITLKVEPIRKKEGEASLKLLQEIGDRNFFPALTKFEFRFNERLEGSAFTLDIIYNDVNFSNKEDSDNLIREVSLDLENGFLTFKMDALDVENDNKVLGEFFFDLELNPKENMFKVEGDIRLKYFSGEKERVGRFSSSGRLVAMPADKKACEK